MNHLLLFLLIFSFLLSGCQSIVRHDYKKPKDSDFETVKCMQIGKQNLNPHQWQAIREATSDVCDIFADPEFEQRINSKNWLASCEKKRGRPDSISGEEVYRLLTEKRQRFSVYAHILHDAEGETENDESNPDNNLVIIDPELIEGWYSLHDSIKARLINVLAHEYVHLLSDRFLDYDDKAPENCDDEALISYGTGDLAEEIWLKRHVSK